MQTRARLVPVVVTALVAALAGVGVLVWYALGSAREVESRDAPASSEASTARATKSGGDVADSNGQAGKSDVVDAMRREEVVPIVPAGRVLIMVRRAEDQAPVSGATVFFAESSGLRDLSRWRDAPYIDSLDLLERFGDRETTDARGCCLIPEPFGRLKISARYEDLCAQADCEFDPSHPWITIDLAAGDAVRVQVLSAEGNPLPGIVATFGREGDSRNPLRRSLTEGRDAIATMLGIAAFKCYFDDEDSAKLGVSVALPLRTRVFVPVDLDALPKEPIVVRVPACGRMAIELRGRDGQPIRRDARVQVTAYPRSEAPPPGASSGTPGPSVGEQLLTTGDGWLDLPYVDVGLTLDVAASIDGVRAGHGLLDGPDAVGQRKEASLTLDYGTVSFVGMLLHADGTPAARERVVHRAAGGRDESSRSGGGSGFDGSTPGEGMTDEQGRYSIAVPVAGADPRSFACELLVRDANGFDRKLTATAVVVEKDGDAFMGTLHVPVD